MRISALLVALVACAPTVDGPAERARTVDREDAARLAAQLTALPGVVRAEVVLRRAVRDPLTTAPPAPAATSLVVIVDDRADRAATARTSRELARAIAPEHEPTVIVAVGATRPQLARVGPFTVERGSQRALKATLAIALAAIVGLAGALAWRLRRAHWRGSRTQ